MKRPDAKHSLGWRNKKDGSITLLNYRDMTFCASDCKNTGCARQFDEKDEKAAAAWWGKEGDAPIALQDFSPGCAHYQPGAVNMPKVVVATLTRKAVK